MFIGPKGRVMPLRLLPLVIACPPHPTLFPPPLSAPQSTWIHVVKKLPDAQPAASSSHALPLRMLLTTSACHPTCFSAPPAHNRVLPLLPNCMLPEAHLSLLLNTLMAFPPPFLPRRAPGFTHSRSCPTPPGSRSPHTSSARYEQVWEAHGRGLMAEAWELGRWMWEPYGRGLGTRQWDLGGARHRPVRYGSSMGSRGWPAMA